MKGSSFSAYARFLQRRHFAVLCVFLFFLPLVVSGALRAVRSNTNNVKDWLPDRYPETATLRWYQEKFGIGSDQIVLIAWEGGHLDDDRVTLMAAKLRVAQAPEGPKLFETVLTGPELLQELMTRPGFRLPREEALRRLEGTLIGPEYLQGIWLDPDHRDEPTIGKVELGSAAEAAGVRPGQVIETINGKPAGDYRRALALLRASYETETGSGTFELGLRGEPRPKRWTFHGPRPQRQAAVLVTLSDFAAQEKQLAPTLQRIRRIASQECDIPEQQLHLGGPPVDNVAIDEEGQHAVRTVATMALGVGFLLCFCCFLPNLGWKRAMKFSTFVFFTALFSELSSLAIVHYAGVPVDAVLLTMPTLVFVLTLSGAIHVVNYYFDTIEEQGGSQNAAAGAVAKGFVPCTLAAATTAVGLGSLAIADLLPIRKFGIMSAIAVMVSLLWLFLYLPSLLQYYPEHRGRTRKVGDRESLFSWATRRWFLPARELVLRRNRLVLAGFVLVMLIFGYGVATRMKTTVKLIKLFDDSTRIVQDYTWLENKLGPLMPMEVIIHIDKRWAESKKWNLVKKMRLVDAVRRRVEALEEVDATMSVVTFVPSLYRSRSFRGPRWLFDDVLNKKLTQNRESYLQTGFYVDDGHEELFRISLRMAALSDVDYSHFVSEIQKAVDPLLAKIDAEGVKATYTGMVPLVYKAQNELLTGLFESYTLAFGLIFCMMVVLVWPTAGPLKALPAAAMTMLPNLFPTIAVFGYMAWSGILVDIGTMMTASVALGVAVDDTVHFLSWYRRGLAAGATPADATRQSYTHCAWAMVQTSIVGGLGMFMHYFSAFTPTMRFGVLMLPLLGTALVGDLLMLPAILAGPFGRLFRRRRLAEANTATASTPPVPAPPHTELVKSSASVSRQQG